MTTSRQPATRSQQVVFTLYGDYLRTRTDEVWTGTLIDLLGPLGFSAQAVRSTLSRMSRQGWLRGRRVGRNSFYRVTPKSVRILDEGAQRLFAHDPKPWDGRWHVLAYSVPERKRHLRDRLRQRLTWLGFGRLNAGTWISPYPAPPELVAWLASTGTQGYVDLFESRHLGYRDDRQLVAMAWDLGTLNKAYGGFLKTYAPGTHDDTTGVATDGRSPCDSFVRRVQITLAYLSFPYVDPGLPPELLPSDWLGDKAAALFQDHHARLSSSANVFVDALIGQAPAAPSWRARSNGRQETTT